MNAGHYTLGPSSYPYTDDIFYQPPATVTLSQSAAWTVIESGCADIGGENLQATEPFNALLRAHLLISDATAAPGSMYEVQLLLDGVPWTWYTRRLRGDYPYGDSFETSAQGIPAGNHRYSVQARLSAPGTMSLSTVWLNGQGSPAAFPSSHRTELSSATFSSSWQQVTTPLTLNNSTSVDVFLSAYLQIDAATATSIEFAFALDGKLLRQVQVATPAALPDSVSLLDHLLALNPGSHTVALWARSPGGTATVNWPTVDFVSFPAYMPARETYATAARSVSTNTLEPQPLAPVLDPQCGKWTKLLELDMPQTRTSLGAAVNWTLDGYVQMLGGLNGAPQAQVAFEAVLHQTDGSGNPIDNALDLGLAGLRVSGTPDGLFHFGDAMKVWGTTVKGATVRLWMRKLDGCGLGGPGSFDVGFAYMGVKYLPSPGCYYQ